MTLRRALITATGVMMLTAGPLAQTKTTENTGKALTGQTTMTGEVVLVDGNNLLVRMQPGSQPRQIVLAGCRSILSEAHD